MPDCHVITLDPLSEYDDPRLYVALESGERVLADIDASLCAGRSPVLVSGPPGVGKTMLLSVLAERERASRVSVRVARSLTHPPDAMGSWHLRLLFGKTASSAGEAELALLERLRAVADRPVLLVVDDIHRTPIGSVRKLAALARGGAPALALVVCGTTGADLQAVTATLAPESVVSLPDFLPEREIETLYDAILAHPGLSPRVLHRLESVPRVEVLRAASGRPGLLRAELARRDPRRPARALPRPTSVTTSLRTGTESTATVVFPALAERIAERKPSRPARQRTRAAAARLLQPVLRTRRAAAAMLESLVRARVSLARVPRAIGAAVRRAATTARVASSALLHSATDSLAHAVGSLRDSAVVVLRAAARLAASGRARLSSARAKLTFAARTRAASLSTQLGDAVRRATLLVRRWRDRVTRFSTGIRATTREAIRRCADTSARVRRAGLRAVPAAALSATALLVVAVYSLSDFEPDLGLRLRALTFVADVAQVTGVADERSAAHPVSVQVNARPWARVRIDGVDLGATPFSHPLPPGVYHLEAEFADGRRIERKIDVGPESRFVSLP